MYQIERTLNNLALFASRLDLDKSPFLWVMSWILTSFHFWSFFKSNELSENSFVGLADFFSGEILNYWCT